MQPLDHITITNPDRFHGSCRVPFCYGWSRGKGLCDFHREWMGRQIGEPFHGPEGDNDSVEERRTLYMEHLKMAEAQIAYHLLMTSLWPGPYAEQRRKAAMREKTLKQSWQEQKDD